MNRIPKWKLRIIKALIGDAPLMINCQLNGAGVKEGWTLCSNAEKSIISELRKNGTKIN